MIKIEDMTIAEIVKEVITLRARVKELEVYEPIIIDPDLSKCEVVDVKVFCCDCGGVAVHDMHCPKLAYSHFVASLDDNQKVFSHSEFEIWFRISDYSMFPSLFDLVLGKATPLNAYSYVK